jgi:hypothetical protein
MSPIGCVKVASGGMAVSQAPLSCGAPFMLALTGLPVTVVASGGLPIVDAGSGIFAPLVTYPTWDPATVTAVTLSGGNLTATHNNTSTNSGARSVSVKTAGKYYFEVTIGPQHGNNDCIGIVLSTGTYTDVLTNAVNMLVTYIAQGGLIYTNGSNSGRNLGGSATTGDVICVAIDLDNRKGWFRKNGSFWNGQPSGEDPATGLGGAVIMAGSLGPMVGFGGSGTAINDAMTANFGATAFTGAVPSGFTSGWPA